MYLITCAPAIIRHRLIASYGVSDQPRRGCESHAKALLTSGESQRQADVSLPRAAVTQGQHILPPADPLTPR